MVNSLPNIDELKDYVQVIEDDYSSVKIKYLYAEFDSVLLSNIFVEDKVGYIISFSTKSPFHRAKVDIEENVLHCAGNIKIDYPNLLLAYNITSKRTNLDDFIQHCSFYITSSKKAYDVLERDSFTFVNVPS